MIFYIIYPEIASKRTPMSALLSQAMGLYTHNGGNGEPDSPTKSMFKSLYKYLYKKDTALQEIIKEFLKQNYEPEYLPESKLVLY